MKKKTYQMPVIQQVSVIVEKGFAGSNVVENDYADPGQAGMLQEGNTYNW